MFKGAKHTFMELITVHLFKQVRSKQCSFLKISAVWEDPWCDLGVSFFGTELSEKHPAGIFVECVQEARQKRF